jgi:hypothetical protein
MDFRVNPEQRILVVMPSETKTCVGKPTMVEGFKEILSGKPSRWTSFWVSLLHLGGS